MITKEQALEFLYELSKTYTVTIDLPVRTFKVTHKDGTFHCSSYGQDLETMIRNFIDEFIRIKKVVKVNFPIPVDVNMLKVGQTYKIKVQSDTNYVEYIVKFINKTEGRLVFEEILDEQIIPLKFSFGEDMLEEIYKVNECIN